MSFISGLFGKTYPINLSGITDWHCHILPGVDDGVQTMEESLDILARYEQSGITEVWATPHIMEDFPNETSYLRQKFAELQKAYRGKIKLRLASENMIDNLFLERLSVGDVLPIGDEGNTLLVETSYFNAPIGFHDALDAVKAKGYYPLLAHPERYNYIKSLSEYRRLKTQGVLFQLNLMSLDGRYGPVVKEKAHRLLTEGLYNRIGSDLHRSDHFKCICNIKLPQSQWKALNKLTDL